SAASPAVGGARLLFARQETQPSQATMNKLPLLVGIAVLQTAIAAQSVVVPNGMAQSNTGTSTFVWRNTEFHFQMLYDPQHFLAQGVNYPITISRLQFRAAGGATSTGGETYNGVTVQMSSSPS